MDSFRELLKDSTQHRSNLLKFGNMCRAKLMETAVRQVASSLRNQGKLIP